MCAVRSRSGRFQRRPASAQRPRVTRSQQSRRPQNKPSAHVGGENEPQRERREKPQLVKLVEAQREQRRYSSVSKPRRQQAASRRYGRASAATSGAHATVAAACTSEAAARCASRRRVARAAPRTRPMIAIGDWPRRRYAFRRTRRRRSARTYRYRSRRSELCAYDGQRREHDELDTAPKPESGFNSAARRGGLADADKLSSDEQDCDQRLP